MSKIFRKFAQFKYTIFSCGEKIFYLKGNLNYLKGKFALLQRALFQ